MCAKANKILGLVKRVCGRDIIDIRIRKLLYISLVRPMLEYISNIWSPCTVTHCHLIENVQRRATKFILNYPSHDITYNSILELLDMLPLEFRREISDLILLFKYKIGQLDVDFSQFFTPVQIRRITTRAFDIVNYHPLSTHKQNYYRKSYFPRSIELWNKLPSSLKRIQSLSQFRNQLINNYQKNLTFYEPP